MWQFPPTKSAEIYTRLLINVKGFTDQTLGNAAELNMSALKGLQINTMKTKHTARKTWKPKNTETWKSGTCALRFNFTSFIQDTKYILRKKKSMWVPKRRNPPAVNAQWFFPFFFFFFQELHSLKDIWQNWMVIFSTRHNWCLPQLNRLFQ